LNSQDAAVSALLLAFSKFKQKLLMSTTIMVTPKYEHINSSLDKTDFFATHIVLDSLGLSEMSNQFKNYIDIQSEIKYTK